MGFFLPGREGAWSRDQVLEHSNTTANTCLTRISLGSSIPSSPVIRPWAHRHAHGRSYSRHFQDMRGSYLQRCVDLLVLDTTPSTEPLCH